MALEHRLGDRDCVEVGKKLAPPPPRGGATSGVRHHVEVVTICSTSRRPSTALRSWPRSRWARCHENRLLTPLPMLAALVDTSAAQGHDRHA